MNREMIKNTCSLMIITIVAGVLLGVVYEVTKQPIAQEKQRAKEEAYRVVFEQAQSFEQMEIDETIQIPYDASIDEIMEVTDGAGQIKGYVLTVTDHEGYGGDIQFAMGVQADGTLNGISFLSLSETAGLGMKAAEKGFTSQFAGKRVEEFRYTKSGATADDEIDALSGATITTNAVTNGVNAGLYYVGKVKGASE